MATNRAITDRMLKSLQRNPPPREGSLIPDGEVRSLFVRPLPGGPSFVLVRRFPRNPKNATRVSLGSYGAISLEQAREKARLWLDLIRRGIDPRDEEERRAREEAQKRATTFAALAEDFIREKLPSERRGVEVARDVRRELMVWANRPITELTALDGRNLIKTVAARAPAQARNILVLMKRMMSWGIDQQCYGLEVNPFDRLKAGKIIGEKVSGNRVLSDPEIFALERAASRLPYPYGPAYRILLRTGLRLNEVADARWREFDLGRNVWTIPSERMKGRTGKARAHVVPLTDDILAVLSTLPRFRQGDFLFSTTSGASPVWMSHKAKQRLDAKMLLILRASARKRGEDPSAVVFERFLNHDIRRSVRSRLSRLRIAEEVREAVLAHVRPGIKGVYDLYDYFDEKREALTLWGRALHDIVEPPSSAENVIKLQARP